jgi:hypothetical protein
LNDTHRICGIGGVLAHNGIIREAIYERSALLRVSAKADDGFSSTLLDVAQEI